MLNILGEAHGDLGVKLAHELMGRAFEVGCFLSLSQERFCIRAVCSELWCEVLENELGLPVHIVHGWLVQLDLFIGRLSRGLYSCKQHICHFHIRSC